MAHIRQFAIILGISFLGELLGALIPLPIPASIYGLVLMFAGLCSGLIKLEDVKDAGRFLIDIMQLMFIPAAVSLMASWDVLKGMIVPVSVIMVVSTFVVMGVTGSVTQAALKRGHARKEAQEE